MMVELIIIYLAGLAVVALGGFVGLRFPRPKYVDEREKAE